MPADARFALLPNLTSKPIVCTSLDSLCARIHAERRGATLRLADHTAHLAGDGPKGRRVVGVYTLTDSGSDQGFIGWAWLGGASWYALKAALFAASPNTSARVEAA